MELFLQYVVNALQWGSFYALIALGYSMVYGVLLVISTLLMAIYPWWELISASLSLLPF